MHFGLNNQPGEKINKLQKQRKNFVAREQRSSSLLNRKFIQISTADDTGLQCDVDGVVVLKLSIRKVAKYLRNAEILTHQTSQTFKVFLD